jgi:hypothetical protein
MAITFPTNTMVMLVAAMFGVGAGWWLSLSQGLSQLSAAPQVQRIWRWGAAIVLITWLLVRVAFAVYPPGGTLLGPLFSIAFLVFGLLAGLLPLLLSPTFRQLVRSIPQTWLVGVHTIRIGGFLFLALLDMRLLPPEFALPAGYGDISVGLLALGLVYLLVQRKPYAPALMIVWNLLGLLDFVVAITTGFTAVGTFVAQIAAAGISPLYVNFVGIVPSFGVPLFALLHIYSLFQLLSPRVDESESGVIPPIQPRVLPADQRSVHP